MIRKASITLLVVVLVMMGVVLLRPDHEPQHLTATFPRTTSLYEGAKVKVLGVNVGKVTSIEVKGTAVEVELTYDHDVDLPADVHALIVPPSIVGDRFIQLAPAYVDGPKLGADAKLGLDRTGVPLELDDTYRSLDQLAEALGPDGANDQGALSRLVSATAQNLSGNGRAFNDAIRDLSGAVSTLAGSSDDIDATVDHLATLSGTFANNDAQVRALVTSLARVGTELAEQRAGITSSVTDLREALALVARFTRTHRAALTESVQGISSVTGTLARHADELGRLTNLAPVGLTSLLNIYVPRNWDPAHPDRTGVNGRAGNQALRSPIFEDLEVQLSYALTAACAQANPTQEAQLAAFCSALADAGGSLGKVLTGLLTGAGLPGGALPTDPSDTSLARMLGAAR